MKLHYQTHTVHICFITVSKVHLPAVLAHSNSSDNVRYLVTGTDIGTYVSRISTKAPALGSRTAFLSILTYVLIFFLFKIIQRRATKIIPELRYLSYEKRQTNVGLATLETRGLRGDQI